ncbi:MAG: hypothetical protein WBA81_02425 [Rhodococcus sp. (in: high G+C Gram-positive bacteria)]
MTPTLWLLLIASAMYVVGRRRSRTKLVMFAQLIGAATVCLVVGQVVWALLAQ